MGPVQFEAAIGHKNDQLDDEAEEEAEPEGVNVGLGVGEEEP